ncbi:hypothetical protein ACWCRD_17100 [Streptomyces sp. NPDC002092]
MTLAHWSIEELLARHWQPVFEYAELWTVSDRAAGVLTASAFTRAFLDALRWPGPRTAWRPGLLLTVQRIVEEWAEDERRRSALRPALRPRGLSAAARLSVPADRRLINRAFHRLQERARCLLWHIEVEAEGLEVPAVLLGLPPETTEVQLESARVRFREACVEAHRELATHQTCLRFSRLLDVSVQRGGTHLVPDLQHHLTGCDHCRHAAEQLDHSGDRLGVLIAEAVLVWGARVYLGSRPARGWSQASRAPGASHSSWGLGHATHRRPADGLWSHAADATPPLSA